MKAILDQMEEHIAAIRNLQRNFDYHSKKLEKLMKNLHEWHLENRRNKSTEAAPLRGNDDHRLFQGGTAFNEGNTADINS